MADELDLDLDPSADHDQEINKAEKRIKSLSEKTRLASEERDAEKVAREKAEAESAQALKDVDFYKNFNSLSSKYQGATEYQEKIREKVNSGYDAEEATIAILVKEGKYVPPAPTPGPKESPTGGSAVTTLKIGDKEMKDMSPEEKRKVLEENLINV